MVLTNTRTLVLIIPHWRVIAAGAAHDHLAAVVNKDRVVDVTPDRAEFVLRFDQDVGKKPNFLLIIIFYHYIWCHKRQ